MVCGIEQVRESPVPIGGSKEFGAMRLRDGVITSTDAPRGQPQDSPRQRIGFSVISDQSPERAYQWTPIIPRWGALSGFFS